MEEQIINELVSYLGRLGISNRQATNFVYRLFSTELRKELATVLKLLDYADKHLKCCTSCRKLTTKEICDICSNEQRVATKKVLVVTDQQDIVKFEAAHYDGLYFVLHGVIDPLKNLTAKDIGIFEFAKFLVTHNINEIISGLPATELGDQTLELISMIARKQGIQVTKLPIGLASGTKISTVDQYTLLKALESRVEYSIDG